MKKVYYCSFDYLKSNITTLMLKFKMMNGILANIFTIVLVTFLFTSCHNKTKWAYSDGNIQNSQYECQEAVKEWIKHYAAFPDSYVPLLFEKVMIATVYKDAVEIVPLRKYTIDHTFAIKNIKGDSTQATMLFELTPDFFVQHIRYRKDGVISLYPRLFANCLLLIGYCQLRYSRLGKKSLRHKRLIQLLYERISQYLIFTFRVIESVRCKFFTQLKN